MNTIHSSCVYDEIRTEVEKISPPLLWLWCCAVYRDIMWSEQLMVGIININIKPVSTTCRCIDVPGPGHRLGSRRTKWKRVCTHGCSIAESDQVCNCPCTIRSDICLIVESDWCRAIAGICFGIRRECYIRHSKSRSAGQTQVERSEELMVWFINIQFDPVRPAGVDLPDPGYRLCTGSTECKGLRSGRCSVAKNEMVSDTTSRIGGDGSRIIKGLRAGVGLHSVARREGHIG